MTIEEIKKQRHQLSMVVIDDLREIVNTLKTRIEEMEKKKQTYIPDRLEFNDILKENKEMLETYTEYLHKLEESEKKIMEMEEKP